MTQAAGKISVREKLCYGSADLASNLFWQSFSLFLLYFYTDVFGISAAVAGTMLLITHSANTVIDPVVGVLADRTQTRWGKFRPWLLWMAVPFGVIGVLSFTTPSLSPADKILYAYATHLAMCIIYSAINVPYSALMGVITPHSIERTSLSSYRFVFAFVGGLIVAGLTIPLVEHLGRSDVKVVSASLDGDLVTLREFGSGTAKLIVTADDGHGGKSRASAYVYVASPGYDRPTTAEKIADIRLEQGFKTHSIALSGAFHSGQNRALAYSVSVAKPKVVSAEISQRDSRANRGAAEGRGPAVLVLSEKGPGTSSVTVTADDGVTGTATQQFTVHVCAPGNRPPVPTARIVKEILSEGFLHAEIPLEGWFTSPQPLTYAATAANDSVVSAGIGEGKLILGEKDCGSVRLTVTADDGRGGTAEQTVQVRVLRSQTAGAGLAGWFRRIGEATHLCDKRSEGTPPSVAHALKRLDLPAGFSSHTVDISKVFEDADGNALRYSVSVVNEAKGFQLTMGLFAAMAVALFLTTFAGTRERVRPNVQQKTSLKQDVKDLLGNTPWIVLFFLGILTLIFVSIRNGAIVYYFKYSVGSGTLATWFLFSGKLAIIASVMMTKWFARWFGKRNTYFASMAVGSLLTGAFYFVSADQIVLMFVLQILVMFAFGPTSPLVWAMYADTADYSEWRTGRRATGLVFSAASFSQKLGWAIGGAFLGWLLAGFGFQPNVEQTPQALMGIRLTFSLIPAGIALAAALGMLLYRLDEPAMQRIEAELAQRKQSAAGSP